MIEKFIIGIALVGAGAYLAIRGWRVLKGRSACCRGDCASCMPDLKIEDEDGIDEVPTKWEAGNQRNRETEG